VENPEDLIIKVISDKNMLKQLPDTLSSNVMPHALPSSCGYRSKCILGFRRFPSSGSQVVFLGMYVHEYGRECPGSNAGRVFLECLDSTPLYSEERSGERQHVLTNIMLAYFEFITAQGFDYAHIRVPPPTDEKGYIFAARSVNVRLRAGMHLAHWFKRLLQGAKSQGSIKDFSASPHNAMDNFPASLLQPAQLAADTAFRCATEQGAGGYGGVGGKDRFFVISLAQTEVGRGAGQAGANLPHGLDPERVQMWASHAMLPSNIAGDRSELVTVLQQQSLHFHTLAHNNYSTMMLVHHLIEEQRCMGREQRQQHHRASSSAATQRCSAPASGISVGEQHAHNLQASHQYQQHAGHPYQRSQAQRMDMSRAMMGVGGGAVHSRMHASMEGDDDGAPSQSGRSQSQSGGSISYSGVSPYVCLILSAYCSHVHVDFPGNYMCLAHATILACACCCTIVDLLLPASY